MSKVLMSTEILYMTLHMCFIEALVIAHTVSEILAQIDHKKATRMWKATRKLCVIRFIFKLNIFKPNRSQRSKMSF